MKGKFLNIRARYPMPRKKKSLQEQFDTLINSPKKGPFSKLNGDDIAIQWRYFKGIKRKKWSAREGFEDINWMETSFLARIRVAYLTFVQKLIGAMYKAKWCGLAMSMGSLLVEPLHSIRAGLTTPLGWLKRFHFHGLNPKKITPEQVHKRPILLIHGNYHNQSAWLSLAKKLKKAGLGPLYTVNLHQGPLTESDREILHRKIDEIKSHYKHMNREQIQIDVIGHSRGAMMGFYMGLDSNTWGIDEQGNFYLKNGAVPLHPEIGKVIQIGNAASHWDLEHIGLLSNVYEVVGAYDIVAPNRSLLPLHQQFTQPSGHLGLIYSDAVHQKIIDWLSESYTNLN